MKIKTQAEVIKRYSDNIATVEKGKRGIHTANQECAIHMAGHNDYTVANKAIELLMSSEYGLSQDAEATVKWFVKYCGLEVGENADGQKEFVGWKGAQFIRDNFKEAKDNPYYKGIKTVKPYEFDLHEALMAVYGKLNAAQKKAANDPNAKVSIVESEANALKVLLGIPMETSGQQSDLWDEDRPATLGEAAA